MVDPFLIAHKVRGEPAFDVAIQMTCPECNGESEYHKDDHGTFECHECDKLGYWWIIPTSGHRAYPYWSVELLNCLDAAGAHPIPPIPPTLRDHYAGEALPSISLVDALGLRKAKADAPATPIARRF